MIYDAALTDEQVEEAERYLGVKYWGKAFARHDDLPAQKRPTPRKEEGYVILLLHDDDNDISERIQ